MPLASVARVESGLTRDWAPARRYRTHIVGSLLRRVPDHEYQTFLVLADGSRRVVRTVNADREGTAMLAHSIRAWLEACRLNACLPGSAVPRAAGEGYDV